MNDDARCGSKPARWRCRVFFTKEWMRHEIPEEPPNGLDGFLKSTRQHIFLKMRSKPSNMCFRLSILPNGHRESLICGFVKCIPRTNEAAWRIIFSPNSAQNKARFRPIVFTLAADLVWIEDPL